jgi:hypothetical protein
VNFSEHAQFLESFADAVAAAGPVAAKNAIARAKATGLDISYIEGGDLKTEAPDGTVRSLSPAAPDCSPG